MTRSINNAYWIQVGVERERLATIELIKKLQKIQHSDFISGDAMTFIIENEEHLKEEKDHPFIYEGWD
jgi:hypothetical protein